MNEVPHSGFDKPEEYETFTTTNGLEDAANKFANQDCVTFISRKKGFIAGAKWMQDQLEKNRLADCEKLTKEEYDRETDFATEIIENERRQPTFTDAINYGMRVMKDQIMSEAVEGEAHPDDCEIWVNLVGYGYKFNDGDQVKLIVIKED